jgi:hypothetical protein
MRVSAQEGEVYVYYVIYKKNGLEKFKDKYKKPQVWRG